MKIIIRYRAACPRSYDENGNGIYEVFTAEHRTDEITYTAAGMRIRVGCGTHKVIRHEQIIEFKIRKDLT